MRIKTLRRGRKVQFGCFHYGRAVKQNYEGFYVQSKAKGLWTCCTGEKARETLAIAEMWPREEARAPASFKSHNLGVKRAAAEV